jgi:hypothetical protein
MNRSVCALICAVAACLCFPELVARDPLPVPLQLPPGGFEVLQIDKEGSYMGDVVRIVDCPKDEDNPFGVCGNLLFGGPALWNSHLSGLIAIQFYPPVLGISHFEISHPNNLVGDDVFMEAPQLYQMGVISNIILDTFDEYSSGDLNLNTGEVTNLNYSVNFFNYWYALLGQANPKLKAPAFTFPGIYGSAQAEFEQRSDGLLDFTFYGSTFLPLGNNISGDPVRLPMPFCGPLVYCGSIQVPGMSLHPHLRITSKHSSDPPCGADCISVTENSVLELTLNSRFSSIGDDFKFNSPELGGEAVGRSQMQGRIQVQFGPQTGDFVPVAVNSLPPSGLLVPPPPFPVAGISLGLLGHDEHLRFPKLTYDVKGVAVADDPFDVPVGELNVKTGEFVGGLLWRSFWTQDLLVAILEQNNGRIPIASFDLRGPARFQKGPNNEILFRYDSSAVLPFTGFTWPDPDYSNPAASFTLGPGSEATPFFRMQGALPTDSPAAVMSGSEGDVLSSFGDRFSYTYLVSCDPAGADASFQYTNFNPTNGGTFTMENLVSASCTNSRTADVAPGEYDTVSFTGFGTWSEDEDPHVATVQVSTNPAAPYVSILVDGGTLSNVNTKPAEAPLP